MKTSSSAIISLSHLGLIACSGQDASKFLQGQFTCDVRTITASYSTMGCYCDQKGRILASFRIILSDEIYYLTLPTALIQSTLTELKKFALFSKVNLMDVSVDFRQIGLVGDLVESFLLKKFGSVPKQENETIIVDDYIIVCLSKTQIRFLVISSNAQIKSLEDELQLFAATSNENAWNLLDIQHGLARIYPETIGTFTPHDLNFPNIGAVSFTKGCYRGQEIVARMQYLGKLKRHLSHAMVTTDSTPVPGMKLLTSAQQNVGEVVMAAELEKNHYELLVVINETAEKSEKVFLDSLTAQLQFVGKII
jgi:hypothetical protein